MKSCTCHKHNKPQSDHRPRLRLVKQDDVASLVPPGATVTSLNDSSVERMMLIFLRKWLPKLRNSIKLLWGKQRKYYTTTRIKTMLETGQLAPDVEQMWQDDYFKYFRITGTFEKSGTYEVKQEDSTYEAAMVAALSSGGDFMTSSMQAAIGIDIALNNNLANAWLTQRQSGLAVDFIKAQRLSAGRQLKSLIDIGESPAQVKKLMQAMTGMTPRSAENMLIRYNQLLKDGVPKFRAVTIVEAQARFLAENRALNFANTELASGFNQGAHNTVVSAIDAGAITSTRLIKRWWTAEDDRVCPLCEPLHGKVVGFETAFNTQLEQSLQQRLPTNQRYFSFQEPPLHNNCRCAIIYEVYS
jgi:hypothetical protein